MDYASRPAYYPEDAAAQKEILGEPPEIIPREELYIHLSGETPRDISTPTDHNPMLIQEDDTITAEDVAVARSDGRIPEMPDDELVAALAVATPVVKRSARRAGGAPEPVYTVVPVNDVFSSVVLSGVPIEIEGEEIDEYVVFNAPTDQAKKYAAFRTAGADHLPALSAVMNP